jgi:hypothetical protein
LTPSSRWTQQRAAAFADELPGSELRPWQGWGERRRKRDDEPPKTN